MTMENNGDAVATSRDAETEHAKRFTILVCIDGTEDAVRALKYAVRVGAGNDADLTLL